MRSILVIGVSAVLPSVIMAQDDGQQYRILKIGGQENISGHLNSWIDISPDGRTIGLSSTQGFPYRRFEIGDLENITNTPMTGWHAGSRAHFSANGNYVLLQQLYYLDLSPNKDRPVKYEVYALSTGERILSLENIHAASMDPAEKELFIVDKQGVASIDLRSGDRRQVGSERNGNAIAVSADGSRIAVAHRPTEAELMKIPSIRNDKKAVKAALKIGQIVMVYDRTSLQPVHMLPELFDKVFRLEYSADGKDLWIHAKPHSRKSGNPNPNQSYVDVADAITGEMRRTSFPSLAIYEPDFRASSDGKLFAIGSMGGKFLEVHLYDRNTGAMRDRFVLSYRLFEKMASKGEFPSDGRLSFTFLPDERNMLMTFGNRLIEWTYAQ